MCLRRRAVQLGKPNRVVLIGDSRIRQLRDGLISHLSGVELDTYMNSTTSDDHRMYKSHERTVKRLRDAKLHNDFFWTVEMDAGDGALGQTLRTIEKFSLKPDIIIIGSGVWIMKDCTAKNISQVTCLDTFQRSV